MPTHAPRTMLLVLRSVSQPGVWHVAETRYRHVVVGGDRQAACAFATHVLTVAASEGHAVRDALGRAITTDDLTPPADGRRLYVAVSTHTRPVAALLAAQPERVVIVYTGDLPPRARADHFLARAAGEVDVIAGGTVHTGRAGTYLLEPGAA